MQEHLRELLQTYKQNMDRQHELDELLLTEQSKEDWIVCLGDRARENQEMFAQNGRIMDELKELLKKPLEEADARVLFEEARTMYLDGYDDCEILLPMLYKLLDHYEERNDPLILMFLHTAVYFEENDIKKRREGNSVFDDSYIRKNLRFVPQYTKLPYEDGRRRIWVNYYNLVVAGFSNKACTADESCRLYQEAMQLWNSPEVKALDGDNSEVRDLIERINNEWLTVEEYIEQASRETKEVFCRVAKDSYEKQIREKATLADINNEVYAAYLHSLVLQGERDFESISEEYFDYYKHKIKRFRDVEAMDDEEFYFLLNTPLILGRWMEQGVQEEKAKSIMNTLKEATQATWYDKLGRHSSPFLNEIMADWCFTLMKYLDSDNEKEEWLVQLLVRRQLPTYLHSTMVKQLAEALCREVNRSRPELFADLTEECKKDLTLYVRQCALLHDVGKTRITDIVNTQCRRLSDWEFDGIRNHPEYGAQMLDKDPELAKYRDVALGHHKFYDGTGGYPADFDNTKSPYRIIIDLITICDCIDAATDHLGRNYKNAKELEEVLKELEEGKETRYNPDLVDVILNSSRLQKELRYIVSDGRLDIFYRAYLESVLN